MNAFVVDTSGLVIVQLRGDHATVPRGKNIRLPQGVHRGDDGSDLRPRSNERVRLARRKISQRFTGAQLASMPNVVALPGAVTIKRGSEIVAGLGVGGSAGGDKDEACAAAGVAAIADQIK